MAEYENFLINPPKHKPKRHVKKHRLLSGFKKHFRKNPLGEELMFVGLNPFKKGGHSMAHKKKSHKRHYKHNPAKHHRRRYHRNPMSSMKSLVPMVVSGGAGALVGRAIPQFVPILKNMGTLGNLISKVGLAIGGAYVLDKTVESKFHGVSDGWMIGSLASAAADLSSLGIVRTMQGLGMIPEDTLTEYTGNQIGMYENSMGELEVVDDNPYADTMGMYEQY